MDHGRCGKNRTNGKSVGAHVGIRAKTNGFTSERSESDGFFAQADRRPRDP